MSKKNSLKKMAEVDIRTVRKEELIDIRNVEFDYSLSQEQRLKKLTEQLKNPYCFRVGEVGVKIEYSDTNRTFEDAFLTLLKREKSGL